ncbi:chemotaxis protein CheW [Thiohalocapsa marina]|uniref:Chemotaxis protein CheW n=1 Tax=Thiohalocapsa marina TaxID=424902 RepID=A0A5M8FQ79_9GAMM|nr:chemotaxis protein CheW [Thiohalocapsa marina]KAA6184615.1 chemotaxis protein CheW [Thiohalocapsa marina]
MSHHLIFELDGVRYAIAADAVRTLFWLPQLSPMEDVPDYFAGMVNLHGRALPVIDLGRRFGHAGRTWSLHQVVVLLEIDDRRFGLLADAVHDLAPIAEDGIEPYPDLGAARGVGKIPVIAGAVKLDDAVLILLDLRTLLTELSAFADQPPDLLPDLLPDLPPALPPAQEDAPIGFGPLDAEASARLRQRTHRLAQPEATPQSASALYALVQIGGERYAIEIDQVLECAHLANLTPIPCCPDLILGCINLRGAILTVLDLAPLVQGIARQDYRAVVVLQVDGWRFGLAVHEIDDIRAVSPRALSPLGSDGSAQRHCRRLLHDEQGVAGVLDLQGMLRQGLLDVNDPTV